MCLITFDWQPDQPTRLVLCGNRDEFYQRPTRSLHCWPDQPVIAGQDLTAGGSWLGIAPGGRFAALTNVRQGKPDGTAKLSRGLLVTRFLNSPLSPERFARQLADQAPAYGPFNLLVGQNDQLCFISNAPQVRLFEVSPGLHTLSNASLDSDWPKTRLARQQFRVWQQDQSSRTMAANSQTLARLLNSQQIASDGELPDTGVPRRWERMLSAQFIRSAVYGTRSSSALIISEQRMRIDEIQWNAAGETVLERGYDVPWQFEPDNLRD